MILEKISSGRDLFKNPFILVLVLILLPFPGHEISGQSYGTLPMGGAGFVSGIVHSTSEKGLRYARTDVGGAYRWDDNKGKWIPLNDWCSINETGYLGVESLALDPNDPDKLYMSVGISYFNGGKSAIMSSSDRGNTFTETNVSALFKIHGNGMGRNTGEKLAVDPNLGSILFCGSRDKGLFKSTDSGISWEHVASLPVSTTTTGNGISMVIFDPSSGTKGSATSTIIVGVSATGDNLFRSDNAGATFTKIAGSPSTLMPGRSALASDGNLYLTYSNAAGPWDPSTGQVWKYNLSSGIWTNITPANYTLPYGGISVDPNNPERIVASTINVYRSQGGGQWGDLIFLSTNGGSSWVNKITSGYKVDPNGIDWANYGLSIHWAGCIAFDPFDTKRVSVISGNGIFTTDNIDSSSNVWKFDVKGLEETVPLDLVSIEGGPVISVVGDYDGFRHTDITKYGTRHNPSMGSTMGLACASLDRGKVLRVGSKLFISEDTARTWSQATVMGAQGYVSISSDGKNILHTPENSAKTYRTEDLSPSSWTVVPGLAYNGLKTVADAVNPSVFYAYHPSGGKIYVSINGGKSFFMSGSPGSGGSKNIIAVPGKEGHVWIALYGGGLTRSVNKGSSFSKLTNVSSCSAVGTGKSLPGAGYPTLFIWGSVSGIEGLYFSSDQGTTWNRINDDQHEWGGPGNGQFVVGDMNSPGLVYMSTAGRGIVYARPGFMLGSSSLEIAPGSTMQINDTLLDPGAVSWSWSSSDPLIASVDDNGLVTANAVGTAIITATAEGGITTTIGLVVAVPVADLSVSPIIDSLGIGVTAQLTATVSPADASASKVSWSSLNPGVATVSSAGLVRGIKTGYTIISAVSGSGKMVEIPVVVGIPIEEISIIPGSGSVDISGKIQLSAAVIPSNTTDTNIKWSTDNNAIASVSTSGLVTGRSKGVAVITASSSDGSVSASCQVNVSDIVSSAQPAANKLPDIRVFPNPLTGNKLTIDCNDAQGITSLSIYNSTGRKIFEKTLNNEKTAEIDLVLAGGIYLLRFESKNLYLVKKLVVEN